VERERAVSQSALMSVYSGKVVLLKANLIYRRSLHLTPVPFPSSREQDDLISYERRSEQICPNLPTDISAKHSPTNEENLISNDCFILDVNRTSVTVARELYFAVQASP